MLRHPADSSQWKKIDHLYLDFGKEAINLRLGLATDVMNPSAKRTILRLRAHKNLEEG